MRYVFALAVLTYGAIGYCEEDNVGKGLSADENRRYVYNDIEYQKKPGGKKELVRTHYIYTGEAEKEEVERMWGHLTPDQKCTNIDARLFHFCVQRRFFDPSARVYFDTGSDDPDEIDIFNDGGLNPTIEFAAVYLPWRFGHGAYFDDWSWGPVVGVGISAPPDDSENSMNEASTAPVVMLSYGLMVEHEISEGGASFALEVGGATGFSSDESLGDSTDTAAFVGLKFNVPMGKKEEKKVGLEDKEFKKALEEDKNRQ